MGRSAPHHSGKQFVQSSENHPNFKDSLCLLLTPLIATLTGLLVSYLWFLYAIRKEKQDRDILNMTEYFLSWRLLPIIYIIAAIAIVCAWEWLKKLIPRGKKKRQVIDEVLDQNGNIKGKEEGICMSYSDIKRAEKPYITLEEKK